MVSLRDSIKSRILHTFWGLTARYLAVKGTNVRDFYHAAHDSAQRASWLGCSLRVLEELVKHAAGIKFETIERRLEQCYCMVPYDADQFARFHVVLAA